MKTETDWGALFAACEAASLKTYRRDKHHQSICLMVDRNGGHHVIPTDAFMTSPEGKAAFAETMRQTMKAFGIIAYVFTTEAWMSIHHGKTVDQVELAPSKDPARIEILWIIGQFPNKRSITRAYEIDRGNVLDLIEGWDSDSHNPKTSDARLSGTFANWLEDA